MFVMSIVVRKFVPATIFLNCSKQLTMVHVVLPANFEFTNLWSTKILRLREDSPGTPFLEIVNKGLPYDSFSGALSMIEKYKRNWRVANRLF